MSRRRANRVVTLSLRFLEIVATALVAIALIWWVIVYAQVISNTGFPLERTLPCLLYTSDRCSLAMALCKDWHFLGIRRYSTEPIWAGFATAVLERDDVRLAHSLLR